jgi:membrane protein DedA with SNARE-associated domain
MEALIAHYGYLAVLVGTFLEGETILILAGFAAHRDYLQLPWVIIAAFLGTLFGDQLFFFLGRRHSEYLLSRSPHWRPRLERAERLIHNYRVPIILGFRFLYGLRSVIPFALGMSPPAVVHSPQCAWSTGLGGELRLCGVSLRPGHGSLPG